ncbi:glycoside hydrolase family 71/99-like protein [Streptomyces brevispora]|uniref:glycoside hydrolase family 71/99-like protein n=1 Tax=Streptomyces brevispora TaxID=887462 RepID=UPI0038193026
MGYQGWFARIGDGAPINAWWHWSPDSRKAPSPTNKGIKSWPDVREYSRTYPTDFPNLNGVEKAALFSSYDQQAVDTHFAWMRDNNIDAATVQRFNPYGSEGPTRAVMAQKVRQAAEATGRKFYIMYDASDWTSKMKAHTASGAYALQNGKPVVCIWGFGFNDNQRPFAPAPCLDIINWFKNQGCYVIGGTPTHWRKGEGDSRPGFSDVYHAFDMISPWMVGRIGSSAQSDEFFANVNAPDQPDCDAHGIDYQPCVMPGDLQERHRAHSDFMWRQFYNMVRVGAQGIHISMFDEYNEGNQIAKSAESSAQVPAGSGIWALGEDGTSCSFDYYLQPTGDGGRVLKRQIALTATRPTRPRV